MISLIDHNNLIKNQITNHNINPINNYVINNNNNNKIERKEGEEERKKGRRGKGRGNEPKRFLEECR